MYSVFSLPGSGTSVRLDTPAACVPLPTRPGSSPEGTESLDLWFVNVDLEQAMSLSEMFHQAGKNKGPVHLTYLARGETEPRNWKILRTPKDSPLRFAQSEVGGDGGPVFEAKLEVIARPWSPGRHSTPRQRVPCSALLAKVSLRAKTLFLPRQKSQNKPNPKREAVNPHRVLPDSSDERVASSHAGVIRRRVRLPVGPLLAILAGIFMLSGATVELARSDSVFSWFLAAVSVFTIVLGLGAWIRRWSRSYRANEAWEMRDLETLARLMKSPRMVVPDKWVRAAVWCGDTEVLRFLLDARKREVLDPLLFPAAAQLHLDVLEELLRRGASASAVDSDGHSILWTAVWGERVARGNISIEEAERLLNTLAGILRAAGAVPLGSDLRCGQCGGAVSGFHLVRRMNMGVALVCSEGCASDWERELDNALGGS